MSGNDLGTNGNLVEQLATAQKTIAELKAKLRQAAEDRDYFLEIAYFDPLTECLNRRGLLALYNYHSGAQKLNKHDLKFVKWYEEKFKKLKAPDLNLRTSSTSENSEIVIINLDVDYLKVVNDRYGHAAGDSYLREVSKILKAHFRVSDIIEHHHHDDRSTVGRLGGDEFVIVLVGTSIDALQDRLSQLQDKLRYIPFTYTEKSGATAKAVGSCSIGWAETSMGSSEGYDGPAARADNAMYQYKLAARSGMIDIASTDIELIKKMLPLLKYKMIKGKDGPKISPP